MCVIMETAATGFPSVSVSSFVHWSAYLTANQSDFSHQWVATNSICWISQKNTTDKCRAVLTLLFTLHRLSLTALTSPDSQPPITLQCVGPFKCPKKHKHLQVQTRQLTASESVNVWFLFHIFLFSGKMLKFSWRKLWILVFELC